MQPLLRRSIFSQHIHSPWAKYAHIQQTDANVIHHCVQYKDCPSQESGFDCGISCHFNSFASFSTKWVKRGNILKGWSNKCKITFAGGGGCSVQICSLVILINCLAAPTTTICISERTRPILKFGQGETLFAQYLVGSRTWVGQCSSLLVLAKSKGDGCMP